MGKERNERVRSLFVHGWQRLLKLHVVKDKEEGLARETDINICLFIQHILFSGEHIYIYEIKSNGIAHIKAVIGWHIYF